MKNFWALVVVVFSFLPAAAQQTEIRKVSGFSGVKTAEGIDVYLKHGTQEEVKVEVTGTDPSNVMTEVSGSYLKIHMKDGRYRSVDAKVYVTYVKLDKLSASSAGSIFSEGPIQAQAMDINAASAGSIEVTLDAKEVSVSSSSAADVELKGMAEKINIDAASAGKVDAFDLDAREVHADAASAGSIKVQVRETLNADASSGGSIRFRGNPDRTNINSTSGGSVRKSN